MEGKIRRTSLAIIALSLIAAAPVDRTEFVFDGRLPAENQQLLEQALTPVVEEVLPDGTRATITFSLRVIEPEPSRTTLLAEGEAKAEKSDATPRAEKTR